jgi:hypothetical protein
MSGEIRFANVEVVRTHKGGFTVVDKFRKRDGGEGSVYVKVWANASVREGDKVTVVGEPSSRISEYTDKQGQHKVVAELHVNNATVTGQNAPF